MIDERRRFTRPEAVHLLDFLVVDEEGVQGQYAMGRTLNISEGGLLMESHIPLPQGQKIMITLEMEEQLIDIMGKIVYESAVDGRHKNGISFFHLDEQDKKLLNQYVHSVRCNHNASPVSPEAYPDLLYGSPLHEENAH